MSRKPRPGQMPGEGRCYEAACLVWASVQMPTTDYQPGVRSLDLSEVSQLCGTAGTCVALPGQACGHGLRSVKRL